MQETRVRSLGWKDSQEEGMATHSSILVGEPHGQSSLEGYSLWGGKESDTAERLSTRHTRPAATVHLSRTPQAEQPLRGCPMCCLPVNRAQLCPPAWLPLFSSVPHPLAEPMRTRPRGKTVNPSVPELLAMWALLLHKFAVFYLQGRETMHIFKKDFWDIWDKQDFQRSTENPQWWT